MGLCLVAMPACTTGSGTHYCLLRLPAYRTQLHHPAAMDLGDLSRHPAQIVGCTVHPPTTLSRGGSAGTGTRTGSPESTHKKKKVLLHLLQKRIYYRIHGYGHRDLSPRRATMALRLARPAAGSAAAAAGGRRAAPRSQSHARRRWAESRSPATERPDPIRRGHRPDPVSRSSRTALDWTTQCKCKCNARSTGRGHREIRLRQGVSGGRSPSWRAHARRVRAMGLWEKVRTRMQHCNPSHTHTHTHPG